MCVCVCISECVCVSLCVSWLLLTAIPQMHCRKLSLLSLNVKFILHLNGLLSTSSLEKSKMLEENNELFNVTSNSFCDRLKFFSWLFSRVNEVYCFVFCCARATFTHTIYANVFRIALRPFFKSLPRFAKQPTNQGELLKTNPNVENAQMHTWCVLTQL